MKILSVIIGWFKPRQSASPQSLVYTFKTLLPPNVLRDVLHHSRDKRQLGVVAAAWIGVTERELMAAAAERMMLPFEEDLRIDDSCSLMNSNPDLLDQLEKAGAVFCVSDLTPIAIACIDPTEIRSIKSLPAERYPIVISTWTAVREALDRVRALRDEIDAQRVEGDLKNNNAIALEAIQLIFAEVAPYNVRSTDLFLDNNRPRYQFVLESGKRGVGILHAKIAPIVARYFQRTDVAEQAFVVGGAVGTLRVHALSEGSVYRLVWEPISAAYSEPIKGLPAPIEVPAQIAPQSAERRATETEKSECLARSCVLLVEDNVMFARILEKYLDKHGFSTILKRDGSEALEWLREAAELPSLVVSDLHMPVMNGRELVSAIRQDEKLNELRIIVLTSDEDAEAEIQMLGIGADAFVAKSKDPRILCSHAVRLANRCRTREAA